MDITALLNNSPMVIIVVLAVMNVMLVAAVVAMGYKMNGNVPPEIALKLLNAIPQEYLMRGAGQVDQWAKSDTNPNNDWIGDVAVSGANLLGKVRPTGDLQKVSKADIEEAVISTQIIDAATRQAAIDTVNREGGNG